MGNLRKRKRSTARPYYWTIAHFSPFSFLRVCPLAFLALFDFILKFLASGQALVLDVLRAFGIVCPLSCVCAFLRGYVNFAKTFHAHFALFGSALFFSEMVLSVLALFI